MQHAGGRITPTSLPDWAARIGVSAVVVRILAVLHRGALPVALAGIRTAAGLANATASASAAHQVLRWTELARALARAIAHDAKILLGLAYPVRVAPEISSWHAVRGIVGAGSAGAGCAAAAAGAAAGAGPAAEQAQAVYKRMAMLIVAAGRALAAAVDVGLARAREPVKAVCWNAAVDLAAFAVGAALLMGLGALHAVSFAIANACC